MPIVIVSIKTNRISYVSLLTLQSPMEATKLHKAHYPQHAVTSGSGSHSTQTLGEESLKANYLYLTPSLAHYLSP